MKIVSWYGLSGNLYAQTSNCQDDAAKQPDQKGAVKNLIDTSLQDLDALTIQW